MLNSDYFLNTLKLCGIEYTTSPKKFKLKGDPYSIENSFLKYLNSSSKESKIDKHVLIESFQEFIEDEANLNLALLAPGDIEGGGMSSDDSIVKILLNIESIQPELSDALLEKLSELIDESEEGHQLELSQLILDQFRWLNSLVDPARLMGKIREVISIASPGLQRTIIKVLPEILVDFKDNSTLDELIDIIKENSNLLIQFVESIQNLEIPEQITKSICELIKSQINLIEIEELSIAIKFLLLASTPSTVDEIIQSIRTELDFTSLNYASAESVNSSSSIADALKSSFLIKEDIKSHWLKTIQSITEPKYFNSIDLIALIICFSIPNYKNQIKLIVKKLVKLGVLDYKLVLNNIKINWLIYKSYIKDLITLAEFCLRSSSLNESLGDVSNALYLSVFLQSDIYYKQEVIGSLVTHFGSGSPHEIKFALNTLSQIVEKDPESAQKFSIFVKGILDYLEKLNYKQLFKLFGVYTDLILQEEKSGERGFRNELEIILRKQLTHTEFKYKKFGVIATLSIIQRLSYNLETLVNSVKVENSSQASNILLNNSNYDYIIFLINMVLTTCKPSNPLLGLFYDNLSSLIQNGELHPQVVAWIHENMASNFPKYFISDTKEFFHSDVPSLVTDIWQEIDSSDQNIYIDILPLTIRYLEQNSSSPINPTFICSYLNLTQNCEKLLSNGNLEDINLLLTLGIKMFDLEDYEQNVEKYSNVKGYLVAGVLVCINWYREIINTFCQDLELSHYVIKRISNLISLEKYLIDKFAINLQQVKEFTPLTLNWGNSQKSEKETQKYLDIGILRRNLRMFNIDAFFIFKQFSQYQAVDEVNAREYSVITQNEELNFLLINYEIYLQNEFKNYCIEAKFLEICKSKEIQLLKLLVHILKLVQKALTHHSIDYLIAIESKLMDCIYTTLNLFKDKVDKAELEEDDSTFSKVFDLLIKYIKHQPLQVLLKYQKSLSLLYNIIPYSSHNQQKLLKLTHSMLFNIKNESISKEDLNYLILEELKFSEDPFEVVKSYIENLIVPFTQQNDLDGLSEIYPFLDGNTFGVYYKIMFEGLCNSLNQLSPLASLDPTLLHYLNNLVNSWRKLVDVIQLTTAKPIPSIILKYSKQFVELICKKITLLLTSNFFQFQSEIIAIFKQIQYTTRSVQNLCGECKSSKDPSITSLIPNCRKSMEVLIYEVKSLLVQNGCESAFWVGNLKHRKINGEVVSSQYPVEEPDNNNEDYAGEDDDEREEPVNPKQMKNLKTGRKIKLQQRKEKLKRSRLAQEQMIAEEASEASEDGDEDEDGDGDQDINEYDQDMIDDGDL